MRAALYARYSTDMQREQSIDDQFRVAERLAERHGFTVVARFKDQAISGGTSVRAGYQQLLTEAREHAFDIIVAEDTSRLWRNLAEQSPRLAELSDLGVHVVTHDLDTRHESAEIMGAVGGAMASAYRKEIGRRVRRGLEGLARNGKSAGGRSFGYIPAAQSGTGQIEIDEAQAAIVRRIFTMYADGYSCRAIADALNKDGIPSAGAGWSRERRRKAGWVGSAIYGDVKRGTGILANPVYTGKVIWNRTKWLRSAADSSKRRQVPNPPSEWITRQEDRLRIVSEELWSAAQARQRVQADRVGERVKAGMSKASAAGTGAGPKFLLSSLLRCAHCGSSYAIVGRNVYGCSGHREGGDALCSNDASIRRDVVEAEVLAGIKRQLLSPATLEEICRRVRAELRKPQAAAVDHSARIKQLLSEIANVVEAIAGGMLKASPALAARLAAAESEVEQLTKVQTDAEAPQPDVAQHLSGLKGLAIKAVKGLERTLAEGNIPKARTEIRRHIGEVSIEADSREIRLFSDQGHIAAALLRVSGSNAIKFGSGGRI